MSTESLSLDILLDQIKADALSDSMEAVKAIQSRFPSLSAHEAMEIHRLVRASFPSNRDEASLIVTAPPSFAIKAKSTQMTVQNMILQAQNSILITGYSLSSYFDDLMDCIIDKSRCGVLVKFFVNDIESQASLERLCRHKGRFLKIYNYHNKDDELAALHAKVISVDERETLITSANLSYHGQQGNIELGTLIESRRIAKQVAELFTTLLFTKVFVEV